MALMENLGPQVLKMGMQILFGLVAIIIITVLFFASKAFFKFYKERKNYKIECVIFNPDGTFYIDKIGKFKTHDNVDKMLFLKNKETMPVIDMKYVRARKLTLWRYAPSQYAVIPPSIWDKMDPKDFKIEVINYQMKNFAYLEQRAAVSRWAYTKELLQRYAPYITMLMCLIFAGVIVYFIMKTALGMYDSVVAARVAECARLVAAGPPVPAA